MADAGSPYELAVLADAPWGYWPLDEVAGTVATDRSGNARNGTYAGGFLLGQPPAASFGGQSVLLPTGATMIRTGGPPPAASPLTLECWIALFSNPNAFSTQMGQGNAGANGMFLLSQSNNCGPNQESIHLPGQAVFCPGLTDISGWHLFHLVRTTAAGVAGILRFYVDGAQIFSQNPVTVNVGTSDVCLNGQGLSNYGNGLYDEFAVYPVELSQSRMIAHAAAAGGINSAPLGGAQGNQIQAAQAALQTTLNEILHAVKKTY